MAKIMSKHSPYPYSQVRCRVHDRDFNVSGYVDTGCDGGLIIPALEQIGLPKPYVGALWLEGKELEITVLFLGNEYLIGRSGGSVAFVLSPRRISRHRRIGTIDNEF